MENTILFYPNFVAQIYLKKKSFFGLKHEEISFFITPSLKIIKVVNPKKLDFLYKQNEVIESKHFVEWVVKNKYSFSFYTKSRHLKRDIIFEIEYEIDNLNKNQKISFFKKVIKLFKT